MRNADKWRRAYDIAAAAYLLLAAGLTVYFAVHWNAYDFFLSLGSALLFPGLMLLRKLTKRRAVRAELMLVIFVFCAYLLGEPLHFYYKIRYFDRVMHTLSGPLTMLGAWLLYYLVKPGGKIEKSDRNTACLFCLFAALAVAGLWEMAEFGVHAVTGMDVQKVAATGVSDSMWDMIVCAIGSLIALPSLIRYYNTGRAGLLAGALTDFWGKGIEA